MFLDFLKREENMTYTENGAVTHRTTTSLCLDLFATIGALRSASEQEIVTRFIQAYAENADLAVKTLFFARDIRGGLGERRVFRTILRWLSVNEPESVRKNAGFIAEFGRFDDLLVLLGTPCEQTAIRVIKEQLSADLAAMANGASVSLLAKWLPSVNAHAAETVMNAKRIARALGMSDAKYRKTLSALRSHMEIVENRLRERKYDFAYEKQPSKALYKYRQAFFRNDGERYRAFLNLATSHPSVMHAGTLTPYDVIAPVITKCMAHQAFSEDERQAIDVTWNALPNFVGAENALAVVDGSASMYWGGNGMLPAAVAQALGIYFA